MAAPASRSFAADPPAALRFLALGDSYTIGEHVDPAKRWPVQLAALLKEHGVDIGEPQIVARTGWTTDELAAGIDRAAPQGPYALVSLLIGVNNQFRGRSAQEYRGQFHSLLERAVGLAGGQAGHVVVLSIPDWGVTPFANGRDRRRIAAEIDRLNAINREEAKRAGTGYVDITPESREAADDPTRVASDGLHPSAKAYAAWARLALPQALAALSAGAPAKPGGR
ncbi:MAG TPA: SGNH/GDSL hydrolase family protein [Thermoanaerobaculia bacterium]|nr:SGNH/GDSL hydrolase family protein [Thermoanaerobaculia bacterium]